MDALSKLTDYAVTKQSISKYEKGIMRPKHDAMAALAKALNISEDYLQGNGVRLNTPMLRSALEGKITDDEANALEARLSFWTEQYLEAERKSGLGVAFHNPLDGMAVRTADDAMAVANMLRERCTI